MALAIRPLAAAIHEPGLCLYAPNSETGLNRDDVWAPCLLLLRSDVGDRLLAIRRESDGLTLGL